MLPSLRTTSAANGHGLEVDEELRQAGQLRVSPGPFPGVGIGRRLGRHQRPPQLAIAVEPHDVQRAAVDPLPVLNPSGN